MKETESNWGLEQMKKSPEVKAIKVKIKKLETKVKNDLNLYPIGIKVNRSLVAVLQESFQVRWGWKVQLLHSFLAILALRLKHDLSTLPSDERFDHTSSTIHSCFAFLAGQSPEARRLARQLSSDPFSFVSRDRAKSYIDPYFEPAISPVSEG